MCPRVYGGTERLPLLRHACEMAGKGEAQLSTPLSLLPPTDQQINPFTVDHIKALHVDILV